MRHAGNGDKRTRRTLAAIEAAIKTLICEKDYDKVTVRELCDRALINKKTFYRYYSSLDALLSKLEEEYASTFIDRHGRLPDDLDQVVRFFFEFCAGQEPAFETIICSDTYQGSCRRIFEQVMEHTWKKAEAYGRLGGECQNLLLVYLYHAPIDLYRQWVLDHRSLPLDALIDTSTQLLCGGVREMFAQSEAPPNPNTSDSQYYSYP